MNGTRKQSTLHRYVFATFLFLFAMLLASCVTTRHETEPLTTQEPSQPIAEPAYSTPAALASTSDKIQLIHDSSDNKHSACSAPAAGQLDVNFAENFPNVGFNFIAAAITNQGNQIIAFKKNGDYQNDPDIIYLTENYNVNPDFRTRFWSIENLTAIALQPDKKIIAAGEFDRNRDDTRYLVRLNADGTEDLSFETANVFNVFDYQSLSLDFINAIAILPDGKIIIGSNNWTDNFSGKHRPAVMRLNSDGSLDKTFICSFGEDTKGNVEAMLVLPDGKLLITGVEKYHGQAVGYITRLNQDGSIDPLFNTNTGLQPLRPSYNGHIAAIAMQSDNKILVTGIISSDGAGFSQVVRLNADGTHDATFQTKLKRNFSESDFAEPCCLAVQTDGKILVGGSFFSVNGIPKKYIARLNTDGSVDSTFNVDYESYGDEVVGITFEDNGKILLAYQDTIIRVSSGDADCDGIGDATDRFTMDNTRH